MHAPTTFADRSDAGRALAGHLQTLRSKDLLVVGLARGGAPVAYEVAVALGAPLEVWAVRRIRARGAHGDVHVGAIAENGASRWVDAGRAAELGLGPADLRRLEEAEGAELDRIAHRLHPHPRASVRSRIVVLVDDRMVTGTTARAAIHAIRQEKPRRVVLALPVAVAAALDEVRPLADSVICLATCADAADASARYARLEPISEDEVCDVVRDRRLALSAQLRDAR